jgi:FAD/FMN-containing dehydrogenase
VISNGRLGDRYACWGRFPASDPEAAIPIAWRGAIPSLNGLGRSVLPYGQGRSYGDACLNNRGVLLDTAGLDRFIAFDRDRGVLTCESGVTLAQILELVVPAGWFLPVTPGTKHVSVGGAIAHDVHGKNHHVCGTFGRYVRSFEILRSDGARVICSPTENAELYRATIAGMGLTGLILWAELELRRIESPLIDAERIRFTNLEEFFELSAASDRSHEYTVAWVDSAAKGRRLGRGHFICGNHASAGSRPHQKGRAPLRLTVPFDAPVWTLNRWTVRLLNVAYYRAQFPKHVRRLMPYETFFYPLDFLAEWNRLYGKPGFLQFQCVVPTEVREPATHELLSVAARSRRASFLTVLKVFGNVRSPGLLSFPRPGVTLALDFPFEGRPTLGLFAELERVVREAGGALYPAKDACMTGESFRTFFPAWREFARYVDPGFSSSFWDRVGLSADAA